MMTEPLLSITEKVVKLALKEKVDQAQATAFLCDKALTRYANSQIHQNVASKTGGVSIKVVVNKRIGTLHVNALEEKQIQGAVKQVMKIVKVTPPNKDFKSLPEPEKWSPIEGAFDKDTATCSPEYRAKRVKELISFAHSKSPIVKTVAGSFSTDLITFAVSNSLGVSAWAKVSLASMKATVISEAGGSEGFGSAEQYSRCVKDIDPDKIAEQATEKSVKSVKPQKIPLGNYEVVLSPRAVDTFLRDLGEIGFSAKTYQDGESFVKYHLNERVFDEKLSVKDDAHDPRTFYAVPIDDEGVPKKAVRLIDKGVVSERSICYNSLTAGRENKRSTGHAMLPGTLLYYLYMGIPIPINAIVSPGDASMDEMLAETKHGIFITTFHYTNPVDYAKTVLTGLTRDGTFLIEKGEISKPVMNLRYTDSMLSALKEIQMIGKELKTLEYSAAPAMKLNKLRFTGMTEY